MPYRQYTFCVQPADYNDPTPHGSNAQVFWSLLTSGGFDQARAIFCDYLMGGKHVCLGGDVCAIGHVTALQPVSAKSFPDSLDNDFSAGILLAPHGLDEFANREYLENYNSVANDGHQGRLIIEQPGMPDPKDPFANFPSGKQPSRKLQGYYTHYPSSSYIDYNPANSPFQVSGSDVPFDVPVLHIECEGSRIPDVCVVLDAAPWGLFHDTVCQIPLIGGLLCTILSFVLLPLLLPIILINVALAWSDAIDGDAADALVGGGTLEFGDLIVVSGRWIYDAAHQGWNEIHAVKTIQKISGSAADDGGNFDAFRDRWCSMTAVVPPFGGPGTRPDGMTPAQTATYDNQLQPENQWIFHPAIDGCAPPPVVG